MGTDGGCVEGTDDRLRDWNQVLLNLYLCQKPAHQIALLCLVCLHVAIYVWNFFFRERYIWVLDCQLSFLCSTLKTPALSTV